MWGPQMAKPLMTLKLFGRGSTDPNLALRATRVNLVAALKAE